MEFAGRMKVNGWKWTDESKWWIRTDEQQSANGLEESRLDDHKKTLKVTILQAMRTMNGQKSSAAIGFYVEHLGVACEKAPFLEATKWPKVDKAESLYSGRSEVRRASTANIAHCKLGAFTNIAHYKHCTLQTSTQTANARVQQVDSKFKRQKSKARMLIGLGFKKKQQTRKEHRVRSQCVLHTECGILESSNDREFALVKRGLYVV